MLEVSSKLGRHYWRQHPPEHLEAEDWDRLPDRLGAGPGEDAEQAELVKAVRQAVDETLTEHQRRLFVAVVLNEVPLDALVVRLGTNRNAVYKAIFDARRGHEAVEADRDDPGDHQEREDLHQSVPSGCGGPVARRGRASAAGRSLIARAVPR